MDHTESLAAGVIRLARHLEIGRRQALAARDLDVWEHDVLVALRDADQPAGLSPSTLMSATQVTSGTMTNRVDRLAGRGLVTREPDPADRRGALVRLTPAGRRRADQARADVRKAEAQAFAALGARKQQQLTAAIADALAALER